jgi:biopolymer transport protein ExbD
LLQNNNLLEAVIYRQTLCTRTQVDHDARLFLRADKSVSYGDLMAVMDALRGAGYLKLALVGVGRGNDFRD